MPEMFGFAFGDTSGQPFGRKILPGSEDFPSAMDMPLIPVGGRPRGPLGTIEMPAEVPLGGGGGG